MMSIQRILSMIASLGALAAALPAAAAEPAPAAPAAAPPSAPNGVLGQLSGQGGDPAIGAALYAKRCASCHDNPTGRAPSKALLASNTRAFIATALIEGIMRPMATGLSTHEMASIAAWLSTRTPGALADVSTEAPLCPMAGKAKAPPMSLGGPAWNGWSPTVDQARFQADPGLAAADVPRLKLKWAFAYPGSRNGQATVAGGRVFLNAFTGAIYALDARTGCAFWRYDAPAATRASMVLGRLPAAAGGKPRYALYFTDFSRSAYALDAETGALIWKRQVDEQNEVQMTGSPVLHGGRLYVTVSSAEEAIALSDDYACCKFRGAVAALDAATGRLIWKTYVTPEPAKAFATNRKGKTMYGPAGGAIWSAPAIDPRRGVLYVATGDSYTEQPFEGSNAVMAIDLKSGAIRWTRQLTKDDAFLAACFGPAASQPANCPRKVGPDADFGASPILYRLASGKDVVLAGAKSSVVWALDPDAGGKELWSQRLSSGGPLGGIEFSMAADRQRLYVPTADAIVMSGGAGKPQLSALDPASGKVLWTALPAKQTCPGWTVTFFCAPGISQAISAMPGAVFAGSYDGRMRAYGAQDGKVLWEYNTADAAGVATVSGHSAKGGVLDGAGPTLAGGMLYLSSGYQGRSGAPGNVLFAFSVDGK
jgi:polyvinyl alcohol dehydrogenase (cytochrome)